MLRGMGIFMYRGSISRRPPYYQGCCSCIGDVICGLPKNLAIIRFLTFVAYFKRLPLRDVLLMNQFYSNATIGSILVCVLVISLNSNELYFTTCLPAICIIVDRFRFSVECASVCSKHLKME